MRYRIRKPSPGMIVMQPWTEDEKSAGGLWIPATAQREGAVTVGTILHVNPPLGDDPEDYFQVGDIIVVGKWVGTSIKLDPRGDTLLLVNEDAVLTTLEEDDSPNHQS